MTLSEALEMVEDMCAMDCDNASITRHEDGSYSLPWEEEA